jgi:hypothetical protein
MSQWWPCPLARCGASLLTRLRCWAGLGWIGWPSFATPCCAFEAGIHQSHGSHGIHGGMAQWDRSKVGLKMRWNLIKEPEKRIKRAGAAGEFCRESRRLWRCSDVFGSKYSIFAGFLTDTFNSGVRPSPSPLGWLEAMNMLLMSTGLLT